MTDTSYSEADYEGLAATLVAHLDRYRGKASTPRAIGVAPGTIENIRRGRIKNVGARLLNKIRGAAARELRKTITELEGVIALAEHCPESVDGDELGQALAALEAGKTALERLRR